MRADRAWRRAEVDVDEWTGPTQAHAAARPGDRWLFEFNASYRPFSSFPRKREPRGYRPSLALGPRFRGGDENAKMGTIYLARTDRIFNPNAGFAVDSQYIQHK